MTISDDQTDDLTRGRNEQPRRAPVLSIHDLVVRFRSRADVVHAVNGIDVVLLEGETLGIVGESGSGKTVSNLAVIGLLPRPTGRVEGGGIAFQGKDLLRMKASEMQHIRGKDIAMVFQDPMTSLNPVLTIEEQVVETIRAHRDIDKDAARRRAIELLEMVGIPNPESRLRSYPHEFSGGMRQRVMIAMALALEPRVLIADEPTTALDVTIQAQVLELLKALTSAGQTSLVLVTHDLGVVAGMTQRVNVMYAGEVVETATTSDLFERPSHPYTIGLLHSIPQPDPLVSLVPIEGNPPDLKDAPVGCPFAPRCQWRIDVCWKERPALSPLTPVASVVFAGDGATHLIACHNPPTAEETVIGHPLADLTGSLQKPEPSEPAVEVVLAPSPKKAPRPTSAAILEVCDLKVYFPIRRGLIFERHVGDVRAVDGVSFVLHAGETLGLVGESGCGKTTAGRAIVRLLKPTAGHILFDGEEITHLSESKLMRTRRKVQMVFQDPYSSLDPRMTIEAIVGEPLEVHGEGSRSQRRKRVADLLALVGLDSMFADRYPHEFSGGQRQRIGVARALALSPQLIVADEPVSALDVSIQAQIINLLERLQADLGLSYVFIAHDLSVVEHISHRTAVMYLGRIVETAPSASLRHRPLHPYSIALWSAIPVIRPDIEAERRRIILQGDIPSPVSPPTGCRFHTRCWLRQRLGNPEICAQIEPPLSEVEAGHDVACHFVDRVDGSPEQRQVARAANARPLFAMHERRANVENQNA